MPGGPTTPGGDYRPQTGVATQANQPATPNNGGAVPHSAGPAAPAAMMTPQQVRSMQQFLVNHGFQVAQDGVLGPQTKSAAAAFRANHNAGGQWTATHGTAVHASNHPAPLDPPRSTTGAGAGSTTGTPQDAFSALLSALLGSGGSTGTMLDPASFGSAAAAPDTAQASALLSQIGMNGGQEKQNQSDISSWYGLDPSDPNYKLSVLGRLKQAGTADQTANNDASSNVAQIAQSLAGSIGGSANAGSGSVAQAGVNDAGMMSALGAADKTYANNMDPLLAAEARGQMSKEKASNQQALLALQQQLAQANGQAAADKATGTASAVSQNNGVAQQRFANEGNLLSTLAQLQAVDPNQAPLNDAKLKAQIAEINALTGKYAKQAQTAGQGTAPTKVSLAGAFSGLQKATGLAPGSTVPTDQHATLANSIATVLQSMGIAKSNPLYKTVGDQMFGAFLDEHGRPLIAPPNWGI